MGLMCPEKWMMMFLSTRPSEMGTRWPCSQYTVKSAKTRNVDVQLYFDTLSKRSLVSL